MPRWAHVPGETSEADHARLAPVKARVPQRFEGFVPADHPALRHGLALNDAGFFWECHEILEAVWMAAPQSGRDRILLRACIQIANANLKSRMQRAAAAARLDAEAAALLDELQARGPAGEVDSFAARFDAAGVSGFLRRSRGGSPAGARQAAMLAIFAST
ncbi:MAG: DUF309 domain-containing protein [Rhizobiales bacterium]|nr:DUF309 domain-containing protein [Hyphomicrobiales bacterium]